MSENTKEKLKAVLLAVATVLFLPVVIVVCVIICRRSSGSGSDVGSADIRRAGESVGESADVIEDAAGESADLADKAGRIAAAAAGSTESVEYLAEQLGLATELLDRLEHETGTDLNRIERVRSLVNELERRLREAKRKSENT